MAHSFSLSQTAVDIVLEHLRLGRAPFPFQIPHIGTTFEQRAQVREAVFRDLEGKGLIRGGRVDSDAEVALRTFVQAPVGIALAAQLEDDEQLFARASSDGRFAVLAKQDGNLLKFEEVRPTNVVAAFVDLLPSTPAAPGQSVTVAKPQPRPKHAADAGGFDPYGSVAAPRSQSSPQHRQVERMFEKPKKNVGSITAFVRGQDGKAAPLPPIAWFDSEDGRIFCTTRHADDGQEWLTYAPADNGRIAQHLGSLLQAHV